MSLTENSEEFIVCRGKVGLIDSLKGKIERLFGTRIYFNEISRDGDKEKRWVKVTGGKWDRQNAKSYILGLSDPEETKTIPCSASFIDSEVLEDIEKNTQAVLSKPSANSVTISGSELAVTLALSALEELTGASQDVDTDSIPPDSDVHAEGTRERSASQRLDEKLDQTFGEESGSLHQYPAAIKRVLLECGKHQPEDDISDDLLHGSGTEDAKHQNCRKTLSEVIARVIEERDPRRHFTAPICRVGSPDSPTGAGVSVVNVDDVPESRTIEGVSSVTAQFPSAAQITPVTQQTGRPGRGGNEESLRDFAKKVGYTDEEVDEGFLYVQPPMKPTEFLEVLKNVKEGKKKLGLVEELGGSEKNKQQKTTGRKVDCDNDDDEDDIMIVDDHFKSPGENKPLSPKSKQGGLSKKEKKKNEQKQKGLAREFRQQQNERGDKKKQLSPQNVNTTGTKRKSDPDSDQEQTCVMEVWEPAPDLPVRVPQIPPRHQRLAGPVHEVSNHGNWNAIPTHVPAPRVVHSNTQYPVVSSSSDSSAGVPPQTTPGERDDLRYVIIDGSNVAMCHGNNKVFSCKGIQIAVDYFLDRGHKVTVFVPEWRKYRTYHDNQIRDQEILDKLNDSNHLVFTPSRKIQGKLVASYDDRFILSLAEKEDSVILSNDQYRDLMAEKASWKKIVEERLLMYRFVGDHFFPAEDPLGRHGPMLDEFLKKHSRSPQTVQARVPFYQQQMGMWPPPIPPNINYQMRPAAAHWQSDGPPRQQLAYHNYTHNGAQGQWQIRGRESEPRLPHPQKQDTPRHPDVTSQLLSQLKNVFPESWQEEKLQRVLENHKSETDLNRLTNYCMEVIFQ